MIFFDYFYLVMVFIHGGSFNSDSGTTDIYGPERFLDYDVVRNILCN